MFSAPTHKIPYDALSAIFFLAPEVAAVGHQRAASAQAGNRRTAWRVLANRLVPRTIAMRATDGFVKLLVSREICQPASSECAWWARRPPPRFKASRS
jgi:dihydrolipoamide dehydrogenase